MYPSFVFIYILFLLTLRNMLHNLFIFCYLPSVYFNIVSNKWFTFFFSFLAFDTISFLSNSNSQQRASIAHIFSVSYFRLDSLSVCHFLKWIDETCSHLVQHARLTQFATPAAGELEKQTYEKVLFTRSILRFFAHWTGCTRINE